MKTRHWAGFVATRVALFCLGALPLAAGCNEAGDVDVPEGPGQAGESEALDGGEGPGGEALGGVEGPSAAPLGGGEAPGAAHPDDADADDAARPAGCRGPECLAPLYQGGIHPDGCNCTGCQIGS
ncbi:MAG TPA: hypothetical protein VFS43_41095 [Polyangiaceae bacterium]|nr:hypothetical protein [Polyangiaceae bacterium]